MDSACPPDARAAAVALLRLHLEWGADEAFEDAPVDRFRPAPAPPGRGGVPGDTRGDAHPGGAAPTSLPPRAAPAHQVLRPASAVARAQALAAGACTLAELRAALEGFDGCPLRATATHTVHESGDPAAGLVLVGEAPGTEDDRTGRAFSGPPGHKLDRMLAAIGLDRGGVLLTTLVPWRPPGSRAPTEAEVQACLPFLLRRLELARPRRLVLLGGQAAKVLTGTTESIRRLRGKWQHAAIPGLDAPVPALPLLPLDMLRGAAAKRDTWADLIALRRALDAA